MKITLLTLTSLFVLQFTQKVCGKIILSDDSILEDEMAYVVWPSNQIHLVKIDSLGTQTKTIKLDAPFFAPIYTKDGIYLTNPNGKIYLYDNELNFKREFDLGLKGALAEIRRLDVNGTLLIIHAFFEKQGTPAQFEAITLSINNEGFNFLKKQKIPFRASPILHRGKIFLLGKESNEIMVLSGQGHDLTP